MILELNVSFWGSLLMITKHFYLVLQMYLKTLYLSLYPSICKSIPWVINFQVLCATCQPLTKNIFWKYGSHELFYDKVIVKRSKSIYRQIWYIFQIEGWQDSKLQWCQLYGRRRDELETKKVISDKISSRKWWPIIKSFYLYTNRVIWTHRSISEALSKHLVYSLKTSLKPR